YAHALFHAPKGVSLSDTWQDRIIPGRRWRGRGPLQRAAVPGIPRRIAKLLASADRDNELHDLADDARQNDECTEPCHQQPRLPTQNVVMLHAPGHAH